MFLFESERDFEVISYSASHGLLLLRSKRTMDQSTRVDILFQDVRAMEMRLWSKGIKIEQVDPSYVLNQRSVPQAMIEPGNIVYSLSGSDWSGYLLAGIVRTIEEEEENGKTSGLTQQEQC